MNRAREMALATALRIDDMIRRGIETRDNLVSLFGLDGQIPSPAGCDAASQVILPPLADLDPDVESRVSPVRPKTATVEPRVSPVRPKAAGTGGSTQSTLDAIKRGLNPTPAPEPEAVPAAKPAAKPPRGSLSGAALAAKLPATFKAAHIVQLTGCSEKAAFGACYRLRESGLAENIGLGAWKNLGVKKGEA